MLVCFIINHKARCTFTGKKKKKKTPKEFLFLATALIQYIWKAKNILKYPFVTWRENSAPTGCFES